LYPLSEKRGAPQTASGATVTTDVAAGCTYQPTTAAAAIKTWQATTYGSMYTVNGDKR